MATESAQMQIRGATPEDRDVLFDVWLRAVQATHTFVSTADIESFMPLVRTYLGSSETEFWVLCDGDGAVMGFMGLAGHAVESLFLAPEFHRRGGGRRLIEQARAGRGALTVDVNEQNTAAVGFYTACGFIVGGQSELDDERAALSAAPHAARGTNTHSRLISDVTQTCWDSKRRNLNLLTRRGRPRICSMPSTGSSASPRT